MDMTTAETPLRKVPVTRGRDYPLLLASQFLSAFGDNVILMIILGPFLTSFDAGSITKEQQSIANVYFTSLLFVPYVFLAPLTGYLNDRFPKSFWLLGGNAVKLAGAAIVALNFKSLGYLVVGVGAAVYSPAKYGILPEILPAKRLVKANGTIELLTLIAILTGTLGGAYAYDHFSVPVCYWIVLGVYASSLAFNLVMSRSPSYPAVRLKGSLREFAGNLRDLFHQRRLARILVGTALFWICGATLKMNFQPWGRQVLQLKSMVEISLLSLWLSLGLMAGSVLAGQLHAVGDLRATRRYGWLLAAGIAVLGSIGTLMDLGLRHVHFWAPLILVLTGLGAGLFLIPLNAALQAESHQDKLGKTIATQNGFENLSMLGGSVIAYFDIKVGFNPSQLFLVLAAFAALVVIVLKIPPLPRHAAA